MSSSSSHLKSKNWFLLRDALFIALLTAFALAFAYQVRARVRLDIGNHYDDPYLAQMHDAENINAQTFRWTKGDGQIELPGQALTAPWILRMRLNGFRPNRAAHLNVRMNNVPVEQFEVTGESDVYEIESGVPADPWTGDMLLALESDTFVPHEEDPNNRDVRRLGIAVDWIEWMPKRSTTYFGNDDGWIDFGSSPVIPPLAPVASWAFAVGLVYATARSIGVPKRVVNILSAVLIVALALGIAFSRAALGFYSLPILILAVGIALLALILTWLLPRFAARVAIPMDGAARTGLTAIVLLSLALKWGGAWYPQFRSSDLVFHAHRLEFVANGNLFFTSELPDAARRVVPYPPALYIALMPLAEMTEEYESLLLLCNAIADAIAIVALYFAARYILADSRFGLFVTFLYAFNPVSFWIYSWGNHTNIFGQTAATLFFSLLLTQSLTRPRYFALALFLLLLASIAHLGVFLSLLTLSPLAIVFRIFAGFRARDANARHEGLSLLLLFALGSTLASLLYYAQFSDVLLAQTTKFVEDLGAGRTSGATGISVNRALDVARYTVEQIGWVLLLAGLAGIPLAWKRFDTRARAVWFAWLLVGVLFGLVTLGSSFSTRYTLWAAPALALSGGLALLWLYEKSRALSFAAYAFCGFAFVQTLWLWVDRVLNGYH